jgi:hypothetical protein
LLENKLKQFENQNEKLQKEKVDLEGKLKLLAKEVQCE